MNNDLISREALKEALGKSTVTIIGYGKAVILDTAYDIIDNAPTVKAYTFEEVESIRNEALEFARNSYERPQGEWIIVKDERYGDNVKCPFCKKELAGTDLNFCCKCGAKLTGSEKMKGGAE